MFSVAGSGKTQHLLDFPSEHWSYYLVSGRINHDEAASQSLLGARHGLASSDTRHLCEVLDGIESPGVSSIIVSLLFANFEIRDTRGNLKVTGFYSKPSALKILTFS